MHFTIEQLTEITISAIPTVAFLAFLSALIFGGGLEELINVIVSGWILG